MLMLILVLKPPDLAISYANIDVSAPEVDNTNIGAGTRTDPDADISISAEDDTNIGAGTSSDAYADTNTEAEALINEPPIALLVRQC